MFGKKKPRRRQEPTRAIVQHVTIHVEAPAGQSAKAVADATRKAIAEMAHQFNDYRSWGDARPPHLQ